MSGTWASGWALNDVVTVAEFAKGVGSISSSTLGAPAASISVSSIAGTYGSLLIVCGLLSDQAGAQNITISLNADSTAANYSRNAPALTGVFTGGQANDNRSGLLAMGTSNVAQGTGFLLLPAYAGTQKKGWVSLACYRDAATTSAGQLGFGHWIAAGATAAITSFTLTPAAGNFNTGSFISVYVMGV